MKRISAICGKKADAEITRYTVCRDGYVRVVFSCNRHLIYILCRSVPFLYLYILYIYTAAITRCCVNSQQQHMCIYISLTCLPLSLTFSCEGTQSTPWLLLIIFMDVMGDVFYLSNEEIPILPILNYYNFNIKTPTMCLCVFVYV